MISGSPASIKAPKSASGLLVVNSGIGIGVGQKGIEPAGKRQAGIELDAPASRFAGIDREEAGSGRFGPVVIHEDIALFDLEGSKGDETLQIVEIFAEIRLHADFERLGDVGRELVALEVRTGLLPKTFAIGCVEAEPVIDLIDRTDLRREPIVIGEGNAGRSGA